MQPRLPFLCVIVAVIVTATVASAVAGMPGALKMVDGKSTVSACHLIRDGRIDCGAPNGPKETVLRLAPGKVDRRARLLGLFGLGDNVFEAVLGWTNAPVNYVWNYEFQVFRGNRGGSGELAGNFALDGGPEAMVRFYKPPDNRDSPKIIIDVMGGATWGTSYLLSSGGSLGQKLFEATAYDFVDLNGDGVYELVSWNRRPDDARCHFGMFGQGIYPEVYLRSGPAYQKAWPPANPGWTQIVALLVDVDGDGTPEIAALTDTFAQAAAAQRLAIYKLGTSSFRLVSQAPVPWPRIGYWLSNNRAAGKPEISVWIADRAKCEAGGDPEGSGTAKAAYVMGSDGLKRTGVRSRH
jgi:hypothetical protein